MAFARTRFGCDDQEIRSALRNIRAKIEIMSRNEPDPEYFTIPSDYTFLDNRPTAKK